ncbi:hypothetical protein [Paraburkholderia rhynchosiae]|uniref:Uncharacterized protein n=1 Tax=Paraburkholderia rhynchosiae TaxID=487049 RepID=A0A2N7WNE1_9BURK|nr:hypothetical protein [Paraburkholderia rhynchosiae]PMS30956.1 hypothetical protein C0Z16_12020 [Paraburkholderia rhynchosiae]CAB3732721.1 hypothetical protein LMG27174_05954 [Paraburkholderia rhynchosiae]
MSNLNRLLKGAQLTSLLSRLGVRSDASRHGAMPLCLVASIFNVRQIEAAYERSLGTTVRRAVLERARQLVMVEGGMVARSGDHILFAFDAGSQAESLSGALPMREASLPDRIVEVLGGAPIYGDSGTVYPAISVRVVGYGDESFDIDAVGAVSIPPGRLPGWRQQFQGDMATAIALFRAMDDGRLVVEVTPVQADALETNYYMLALTERIGNKTRPLGIALTAVERLGLTRRLDRWVVNSLREVLVLNPSMKVKLNTSIDGMLPEAWRLRVMNALLLSPETVSRVAVDAAHGAILSRHRGAA